MANYLYNGMELPVLPEHDKPYAVISDLANKGTTFYLFVFSAYEYKTADTGNWIISYDDVELYIYESDYHGWEIQSWYGSSGSSVVTDIEWVNGFDLLNEAASEPVPVVSVVSEELAFLIGKELGRRIFR